MSEQYIGGPIVLYPLDLVPECICYTAHDLHGNACRAWRNVCPVHKIVRVDYLAVTRDVGALCR